MFKDAVFCSGTGGFFPANEAAEKSMEGKQTSARRWIFMAAVILQPICLMQDTLRRAAHGWETMVFPGSPPAGQSDNRKAGQTEWLLTRWHGMGSRSRLHLDHHSGNQHGYNSCDLHDPQPFIHKKHRKQDGEDRLQATRDHGPRGIKVFESA